MILQGKHIFMVEDDRDNMAIIMTILQFEGAKVHIDRWGNRSIEMLKKLGNIDLILMDLHLPHDMDGYDLYTAIQEIDSLREIPVVIVSASDPNIEMRKAQDMGFAGFVSKPVNYRTFAGSIARIFDGKQLWDEDFRI